MAATTFCEHVGRATFGWCADREDAFLLAYSEEAAIEGPNFAWFKARHRRFLYIDRVAVAACARGRGLARALYETLFDAAQAGGWPMVCAEVNADPPNPASDAFHEALGFAVVGRAYLADRNKTVRYYARWIREAAAAPGTP